jgi:mRNA-degrading endonuclease RelE of RelBE toxin-antitoxin system
MPVAQPAETPTAKAQTRKINPDIEERATKLQPEVVDLLFSPVVRLCQNSASAGRLPTKAETPTGQGLRLYSSHYRLMSEFNWKDVAVIFKIVKICHNITIVI